MQSCLGISVSDRIIKYAKVQKDNNNFKVLSFGVKFYDNLELQSSIQQIINETDSKKIPVSINTRDEKYYYFNIFNLTNKEYAKKAIETEFESFCSDNHINMNAYEGRFTYTKDLENPDKNKVMYIYDGKTDLNEMYKIFSGSRIMSCTPIATSLPNIAKMEKNKNIMIVDLEDKTTITTVINQNIYSVDMLEDGLKEAFESINDKENSYLKTYEVLKNTTIYTMETDSVNANNENSEYLQSIVPHLYKIAQELQGITKNYKKVDQIYLTGMGTVINNIDLYFQEYFNNVKVEILKPFFIENDNKVNIKDYIEVNSAIAIAIQGLGFGIKTLNFRKTDTLGNLKSLLNTDIKDLKKSGGKNKGTNAPKEKKKFSMPSFNIDTNLKGQFDRIETAIIRNCIVVLIVIVLFSIASVVLANQIESSIKQAQKIADDTDVQINLAKRDNDKILSRTQDYTKYKKNLEDTSSAIETKRGRKNQITTLLNKIVYTIPKEVVLKEIKNTEKMSGNDKTTQHITITAEANKYEYLAYFKAKLKNANILENIVSSEGTKNGEVITITIDGDLRNY